MDRPRRIVIMRHAESQRNKAKKGAVFFADEYARSLVKGIPDQDIELTENGRMQARLTGPGLKADYGLFDYIYHSGYKRTEQTMDEALQAYTEAERGRMKIRMNPWICERDSGYGYDMTKKEAKLHFPYLDEYWKMRGGFFARPPGGQSLYQKTGEVYLFINMLYRDRAGQSILVITHGGTIRCIRFLLERWTYKQAEKWPEGQSPKNCGILCYEFMDTSDQPLLKVYNRIYYPEHLYCRG